MHVGGHDLFPTGFWWAELVSGGTNGFFGSRSFRNSWPSGCDVLLLFFVHEGSELARSGSCLFVVFLAAVRGDDEKVLCGNIL